MPTLNSNENFKANQNSSLNINEPESAIDEKAKYFSLDLENKTKELKQCQAEHNLNSCLPCSQLLACKKRNAYVKAAFDKMCQGEDRGFIF
ncbi:hypothetical protein CINF_1156 [Candidatus Campylobacter infans]|uniref:Uncharacterized protein n=1 Tax=Candidatus Campylobacter infans TaxID=2561898 RepID=A0A7H9CHS5_9BACT|nr:hypothetical protein [Candidatus Campylobacter infans]KAF0590309.1 MAG: hypothetical protein CGEMS_1143 [Candidatus Campylobacter infans]QLI05646.1 hypothetical protein CINF_1156 [Candidatus Campylobacter infans]